MPISTDLHVFCQTTNASIQKLKANRCISWCKWVHLVLVALSKLPLLDLLLRQIAASKPICDRIGVVWNQVAIATHPPLLHSLTTTDDLAFQRSTALYSCIQSTAFLRCARSGCFLQEEVSLHSMNRPWGTSVGGLRLFIMMCV